MELTKAESECLKASSIGDKNKNLPLSSEMDTERKAVGKRSQCTSFAK